MKENQTEMRTKVEGKSKKKLKWKKNGKVFMGRKFKLSHGFGREFRKECLEIRISQLSVGNLARDRMICRLAVARSGGVEG